MDDLVRTPRRYDDLCGLQENAEITLDRPGVDVVQVEQYGFVPRHVRSTADLPQASDTRPYDESPVMFWRVLVDLGRHLWSRSDQAHLALEHIDELR